jgi:hypothetical protein
MNAVRYGLLVALVAAGLPGVVALVVNAPDTGRRSPYDAWRLAETEATLALAAWRGARRADKRAAYATYVAALDAEAGAASRLRSS